jgi:hypothetical protein
VYTPIEAKQPLAYSHPADSNDAVHAHRTEGVHPAPQTREQLPWHLDERLHSNDGDATLSDQHGRRAVGANGAERPLQRSHNGSAYDQLGSAAVGRLSDARSRVADRRTTKHQPTDLIV